MADAARTERMAVRFTSWESYGVAVCEHRKSVDEQAGACAQDSAPIPTDPFVAALATRVVFYAGAT